MTNLDSPLTHPKPAPTPHNHL